MEEALKIQEDFPNILLCITREETHLDTEAQLSNAMYKQEYTLSPNWPGNSG